MPVNLNLTNFTAGELSPKLRGRTDLSKYHNGCLLLENFISLPYGGAMRRPGTYYVAEVKDSTKKVRLVRFVFSVTERYTLEFGENYIRFYKNSGPIMGNGSPYEVTTTYTESELFQLHFVQSADVLFIAHPNHKPAKLSRTGDTAWTLEDLDVTNGPFLLENDSDITIKPPDQAADVTADETYADSTHSGASTAAKVFDDVIGSGEGWLSELAAVTNQWVRVQFAAAKTITKVRIQPCRLMAYSDTNPKHVKIEGSNNATDWDKLPAVRWHGRCEVYNTDEILLHQINNYDDWAEVDLNNTTAYTYYRLFMADTWGSTLYMSLQEMEMMEAAASELDFEASSPIWTADHVGALWKLSHPRAESSYSGSFVAAGNSGSFLVDGKWEFVTHGTWRATITIQRSLDGGATWEDCRTFKSLYDQNRAMTGTEEDQHVWYRISCTDYSGSLPVGGQCSWDFSLFSARVNSYVRITTFSTTQKVRAAVLTPLGSREPTARWAEGAWSAERGYPARVTIHERRLVFANTTWQPETIWFSQTDNYECFELGDKDTDALQLEIASNQVNAIEWICPGRYLNTGTVGSEWTLGSSGLEEPLAPLNLSARQHSNYGSEPSQPVQACEHVLYIQREARKVRQLVYSFEQEGYRSLELTILADHVTAGGITVMDYQRHPVSVVWAVRSDGQLLGMTYEPAHEVLGWHRHITDGEFESVAVIPGDPEDQIWVSVKRGAKRYVEYFMPHEFSEQRDWFYVDCGVTGDNGDKKLISGITQDDPGVVTATAHGFANDDHVRITEVVGMVEVNNVVFTVKNKEENTFELYDEPGTGTVDTSGYGAYDSGGKVEKVTKSFSELAHLNGKTVSVLADGAVHADVVVAGGSITLTTYANEVQVGLPYKSSLKPMPIELGRGQGTAQGRVKLVGGITLRAYQSVNCKVGRDVDNLEPVTFNSGNVAVDADAYVDFPGTFERQGTILVVQDQPLPLSLIALVPEFTVFGSGK